MKNNAVEFAEWWKSVYKEKLAAVYIDERFTNDKRYVMNEKIKLLAEQAHLYNDDDSFLIAALENFAELIVKECADLINSMDHSSQYFPHVADAIKEHFGVEE
jgi:hypothetical protein